MPLLTEQNTPAVEAQVLKAASKILKIRPFNLETTFEHGQWWVTSRKTGAQWSVVDAEGGQSQDGLDLEQVTEGDEG